MKSSGGNWLAGAVWSPSRSRTVWLYWLCVSRRSSGSWTIAPAPWLPPSRYRSAAASSSPESCASLSIQAFSIASSGLPGLMRSPPACGDALRRLLQQQRRFRDARGPPASTSELPNASIFVGRRVRVREMQAGGRRHAIRVVAGAAARLFQHRDRAPYRMSYPCAAEAQPQPEPTE